MGSIVKQPGSLYFIKEEDLLSKAISSYVKIGLVRDDKETEKRIAEHQTGNPRKIYNHKTLYSPFVEHLETQMHYRFAEKWITGEWFNFTDTELKNAIKEAQKIIKEQENFAAAIEEAALLKDKGSNGEKRDPSKEELKLWKQFITLKEKNDVLAAKKTIVAHKIRSRMGNALHFDGIAEHILKKDSTGFSESSFKKEHPEIHAQFVVEREAKTSGTFSIKGKNTLKNTQAELYEQKKSLEKISYLSKDIDCKKSVKRNKEDEALHFEYIKLQKELYILEWECQKLEAKIKVALGTHSEIQGI